MILREKFSPMCFLSALGAGGLSVSFFMYLMFLVPHKGSPMATFDFIYPEILKGTWLSVVSVILIWNTKQFNMFKKSDAYKELKKSNSEINLMTIPLTFAMTINVCFILGSVFIPNLWQIVEYLFPFALIAYASAGFFALKIFFNYFSRLLIKGDFDFTKNNNLSQMISIFAFAMIGVGFAAPGAMSHSLTINAIGIFFAIFFASIAVLLLIIKLTLGFQNMFEHGVSLESSPSLWIILPILTLLGITFFRVSFGFNHHFNSVLHNTSLFTTASIIVSLQIIFGVLGYKVMKELGYFEKFIDADNRSSISFALICPGVAFLVFGMFFINFGLVLNGIVDKYSLAYFLLMLPFIYVQIKTIIYFFKLKKKFLF